MKNEKQIDRIEELLSMIPTRMCRNMSNRFANVILKDLAEGLAKHHFMIMKMLKDNDRQYVTEIVDSLGITKSQMTASVNKLLDLEYVERITDPGDRRKIYIALTEDGHQITDRISKRMKDVFHQDIKVLNQDELNKLEDGLKILNKICLLSRMGNE